MIDDTANLDTPTLAELTEERAQLMLEKEENHEVLVSCRGQIDAAKARAFGDRDYSDPKWFAAVNSRARWAGRRDQQIQHRLAELRPLIAAARQQAAGAGRGIAAQTGDDEPLMLLISALQLIQRAVDLLRGRDVGPC